MKTLSPKVVGVDDAPQLTVLGDHQRVRLRAEDTGGLLALVEQQNPPGTGVPFHVHSREDEAFHVVEGQVSFRVDKDSFVAGPGTTVFAPRGTPHAFQVVGESNAKVLLTITPGGLERMFEELAKLPATLPPDMAKVARICSRYGITIVEDGA